MFQNTKMSNKQSYGFMHMTWNILYSSDPLEL
jgi:hypothetical protein